MHRPNQKSTDGISSKLRNSLLPVPNHINIQGPKRIPTPVLSKGKPEIPFLHTLWIRTLSNPRLPQPHHILSGPAPILPLNTPILQGGVPKLVLEPCYGRVIQEPDSISLLLSRLVRIGTCGRLIG